MRKATTEFEFDVPRGWIEGRGVGKRLCFHGPHGEELIVSGAALDGDGPPDSLASALDGLWQNGLAAALHGAAHPELRITKPLGPAPFQTSFPLSTVNAVTSDGATLLLQAVVGGERSVLLISLEMASDSSSEHTFQAFLQNVRWVRGRNPRGDSCMPTG